MTKRTSINSLADSERSQMDAWADRWIEVGLRTGPADCAKFEAAAKLCYAHAELAPPKVIVWVPSPLVLALAAPIAAEILDRLPALRQRRDAVGDAVDDAVRGAVGDAVGDAMVGAVGDAVGGAVGGAVGDAVDGAVVGAVGDAVDGAVRDAVVGAVGDAVGDAVRGAVGGAVRGAVGGAVGGAVRGAVGDAVVGAVGDAVGGAVGGAVGDAVGGAVVGLKSAIARRWRYYLGGQFWVSGWWWGPAFTSFFREVCGLALKGDLWERGQAYEATIESACWWWPHRDFIMVCERPAAIHREQIAKRGFGSHRLHNDSGPAVSWDGWGVYAIHGVRVPRHVVEAPHTITLDEINAETNAEVQRVMIERYGEDRYIVDSKMKPVALDEKFGDIYLRNVQAGRPIAKIRVVNRSPEPDGSFRIYWLSFNPAHYSGDAGRIPQAAIASTWRTTPGGRELFFKDWRDYRPEIET